MTERYKKEQRKGVLNYIHRIVGEGTKPGKVHPGDLVISQLASSPTGWTTPAMIRMVTAEGELFTTYSKFSLNGLVQIACPGGKGHRRR